MFFSVLIKLKGYICLGGFHYMRFNHTSSQWIFCQPCVQKWCNCLPLSISKVICLFLYGNRFFFICPLRVPQGKLHYIITGNNNINVHPASVLPASNLKANPSMSFVSVLSDVLSQKNIVMHRTQLAGCADCPGDSDALLCSHTLPHAEHKLMFCIT